MHLWGITVALEKNEKFSNQLPYIVSFKTQKYKY